MAPQQLDDLVDRIALYPDPLLAQVLTGSTFWNEIPDAANWANQHNYLRGDELSRAIYEDNLSFDPSVLELIPFPSVLDMMGRDPGWTQALGSAVLNQRPEHQRGDRGTDRAGHVHDTGDRSTRRPGDVHGHCPGRP